MAEINTVIAEASQDLQTIEDFVNLPADSDVRPRLLPSVNVGTLAGTRDAIFRAGGLPAEPFKTKALMTASSLVDGKYAMVTDDTVNNGLYVKTAGAWVKSNYDPHAYTDKIEGLLKNGLLQTINSGGLQGSHTGSGALVQTLVYKEVMQEDAFIRNIRVKTPIAQGVIIRLFREQDGVLMLENSSEVIPISADVTDYQVVPPLQVPEGYRVGFDVTGAVTISFRTGSGIPEGNHYWAVTNLKNATSIPMTPENSKTGAVFAIEFELDVGVSLKSLNAKDAVLEDKINKVLLSNTGYSKIGLQGSPYVPEGDALGSYSSRTFLMAKPNSSEKGIVSKLNLATTDADAIRFFTAIIEEGVLTVTNVSGLYPVPSSGVHEIDVSGEGLEIEYGEYIGVRLSNLKLCVDRSNKEPSFGIYSLVNITPVAGESMAAGQVLISSTPQISATVKGLKNPLSVSILTSAEYDNLANIDASTLYAITD